MDFDRARNLLMANACCDNNRCDLCPFAAEPPSEDCESYSAVEVIEAVQWLKKQRQT